MSIHGTFLDSCMKSQQQKGLKFTKMTFLKKGAVVFGQKVAQNEQLEFYHKLVHRIFLTYCIKLKQHKC